jgi:tRNA nucleotidyltransferase (CCA-adding enzyme)
MPRGPELRRAIRLTDLDAGARAVLQLLARHGHEAALVGGCVRDLLQGTPPVDWDVATGATPEAVTDLFPGSTWENPFGTVTVRAGPERTAVEVTTYRVESAYRDHRRPERVRWGGTLEDDLSRRDFTVNALAWLPPQGNGEEGRLVDPHGGLRDLEDRVLRAVGDPDQRIAEDALRLLRAVRFALRFGLSIEPGTEAAIRRNAGLAAELSGERVRDELLRMLAVRGPDDGAPPPSAALALLEDLQILPVILPELAALRGVPQAKALPGDAFDHSLRTVDALPADDPLLRLIGALHDVGKATTLADGHFIGHETLGARMVEAILRRLRFSKAEVARGEHLVRMHMFDYRADWTDAAVRRFIRRVGARALPDLFALRRADDAASGVAPPEHAGLDELRARVGAELASHPLSARQLAVHGDDLTESLGIAPGPVVGRLLHRLMEAVLDDPLVNDRATLLALARSWLPAESVVPGGTPHAPPARNRTAAPGHHG